MLLSSICESFPTVEGRCWQESSAITCDGNHMGDYESYVHRQWHHSTVLGPPQIRRLQDRFIVDISSASSALH